MPSSLILTQSQIAQLKADISGDPTSYVTAYTDLNADITADESSESVSLDAGTAYWYSQAQYINALSSPLGEPSWFFIRDVTEYGERLHDLSTGNTQSISNAIASSVLGQITTSGIVTTLPNLLGQDISESLSTNNINDLGAWGGSFYYWNVQPIEPSGVTEPAVGVQIAGTLTPPVPYDGGGSFDVFLATNGAALYDSNSSIFSAIFSTSITAAWNEVSSTLFAAYTAQVPATVRWDVVARAFSDELNGSIVGTPNMIDGNIYAGGQWFSPNTSSLSGFDQLPSLDAPTGSVSVLDAERDYRISNASIDPGSNSDLGALGADVQKAVGSSDEPGTSGGWDIAVNPDASYTVTDLESASSSGVAFIAYNCDAAGDIRQSVTYNPFGAGVELYGSGGNSAPAVATENFGQEPAADGSSIVLNKVTFSEGAGDFQSDVIEFVPGSTTVSSFTAVNEDGSKISYMLTFDGVSGDGSWEETFYDSKGTETERINYGYSILDPSTGESYLGTGCHSRRWHTDLLLRWQPKCTRYTGAV